MMDMKAAGCPSPPSYVPRFMTGYTDKMDFRERTINTLVRACYHLGGIYPLSCKVNVHDTLNKQKLHFLSL